MAFFVATLCVVTAVGAGLCHWDRLIEGERERHEHKGESLALIIAERLAALQRRKHCTKTRVSFAGEKAGRDDLTPAKPQPPSRSCSSETTEAASIRDTRTLQTRRGQPSASGEESPAPSARSCTAELLSACTFWSAMILHAHAHSQNRGGLLATDASHQG